MLLESKHFVHVFDPDCLIKILSESGPSIQYLQQPRD